MKKILNKITLASVLIFPYAATAEHVLPVFSGYWYTEVKSYQNACYTKEYYDYENKGDALEIGKRLLPTPPSDPNCQWGDVYIDHKYHLETDFMPLDFPGSADDWDNIKKTPQSNVTSFVERDCLTPSGVLWAYQRKIIQPSYACPANSRNNTGPRSSQQYYNEPGCNTAAIPCMADVVGRNLNVPVLGAFGHVGLVYYNPAQDCYGNSVIEVLSTPHEAIYINSLDKFKNIPDLPYWGAKYQLSLDASEGVLFTYQKAADIFNAAERQRHFPFEYTTTWDWHPGSEARQQIYNEKTQAWQIVNAMTSAKFRCDSFVYYAYLAGANLHILPTFEAPDSPLTLFNAFLKCSSAEGTRCGTGKQLYSFSAPKGTVAQIQSVFADKKIDIQQADYSTKSFIKDKKIPRAIKINQLWSLALKSEDNPEKFTYLIDCLATLKPLELTTEIIQVFKTQTNITNQRHLLVLLIDALQFQNQSDLVEAKNQLSNIIAIQHFVRDLLYQSQNQELLHYAIQMYPSIVSPEVARQDIANALNRKDLAQAILSSNENSLLMLRLAFSSKEQQISYLPSLLLENNENVAFNSDLCFVLSDFSPEDIDDQAKKILVEVLERNQSNLLKQVKTPSEKNVVPTCNWLQAYATVKTTSMQEKNLFIKSYTKENT